MLTRLLTILPLLLGCMWMLRNWEPLQRQGRACLLELPMAARIAEPERELAVLRARLQEPGAAGEPAPASALVPTPGLRRGAPVQPG
jgi:hypothetical protein